MITFLVPGMLALLAALGIPLLIHLRRRDEARRIAFAALRWLRPAERRQRRLRFRELPLLLLRLALLTMFALLLGAPQWRGARSEPARVAVIPGADWQGLRARWPDARWHWLAPGWPALDSAPPAQVASASLLRQLDRELPPGVPLHVLAPVEVGGLDGAAIVLSRPVDWLITDGRSASEPTGTDAPPRRIAIRADAAHARTARLLTQALAASGLLASAADADLGPPTDAIADATDTLLWLATEPPPPPVLAWLSGGGSLLRVCAEADCPALPDATRSEALRLWSSAHVPGYLRASAYGSGRLLDLHATLQARALPAWVEPDFPALLRDWLQLRAAEPDRAPASAISPLTGAGAWPSIPLDLRPWALGLLLVLLLAERWLVWRRRPGATP